MGSRGGGSKEADGPEVPNPIGGTTTPWGVYALWRGFPNDDKRGEGEAPGGGGIDFFWIYSGVTGW